MGTGRRSGTPDRSGLLFQASEINLVVITVVWETWLKAGAEAEGLRLTRQIWSDMRAFEGYVSHQLLVDQDAPGHIIVLGRWRSRDEADRVREQYKDAETVRLLTPLLARPRDRWVTVEDEQVLRRTRRFIWPVPHVAFLQLQSSPGCEGFTSRGIDCRSQFNN